MSRIIVKIPFQEARILTFTIVNQIVGFLHPVHTMSSRVSILVLLALFSGCSSIGQERCENLIVWDSKEYCEISFNEALLAPQFGKNIAVIGYMNLLEIPAMFGLRAESIEGPIIISETISLFDTDLSKYEAPAFYRVFGRLHRGRNNKIEFSVESIEYWKPKY